MNIYKKCSAEPSSILVIGIFIASDNSSNFRKNLPERIQKLTTTIDDKINDEELQYNINREATKISVLLSGKINKHEYLTGYKIYYHLIKLE